MWHVPVFSFAVWLHWEVNGAWARQVEENMTHAIIDWLKYEQESQEEGEQKGGATPVLK